MYKSSVTMEVLTSNGNPVTEYKKNGDTYIEGRKGSEFSVRLRNHSGQRVHTVLSIDGLDVVDGEKASYKSRGYILDAYQSMVVDGWRTDLETVRKFFFTREKNTYSKKSGQGTTNLGVIGLAVFAEKVRYVPPITVNYLSSPHFGTPTIDTYSAGPSFKNASRTMSVGSQTDNNNLIGATLQNTGAEAVCDAAPIGTGMGQEQASFVREVHFEQNNTPFSVMQIFYKERKELERLGVIKQPKTRRVNKRPEAFPGQFCKEV